MDKEGEPNFTDGGYSEQKNDQKVDQVAQNDHVVAGNIFDPSKKVKKKIFTILDSTSQ